MGSTEIYNFVLYHSSYCAVIICKFITSKWWIYKKISICYFFIRFSLVTIYWIHINKDIKRNFIFEGIFINFEEKIIILQTHRKKKIFNFEEIKTINIRDIKNIDAEKNPEGKYSLEFIVNEDSSKYLWGFALSESKAQEIKEKLLKIFRGEASYEIS